jgi:hypothetical protein
LASESPVRGPIEDLFDEVLGVFAARRSASLVAKSKGPRGQDIWAIEALTDVAWIRGRISLEEMGLRVIPLRTLSGLILEVAGHREPWRLGMRRSVVEPGAVLRCATPDGGEECLQIPGDGELWRFARRLVTAWISSQAVPSTGLLNHDLS